MSELQRSIGSREFTEFLAWERISLEHPDPETLRADIRAGQICATIANYIAAALGNAQSRPLSPADFFPSLQPKPKKAPSRPQQTPAQQKAILAAITAAHNQTRAGGAHNGDDR